MQRPYRVMVWGPGRLGSICIWETWQSPAFEFVGVRAYSAAKHGIDVGDLLGLPPFGPTLHWMNDLRDGVVRSAS